MNGSAYLVEVIVDRKVVPRLPDGRPPSLLFRIMSAEEYDAGRSAGAFVPRERTHASIRPLLQYAEPGAGNVLVAIAYDDSDGWKAKQTSIHGVVAVTDTPLPGHRVALLARGTRDEIEITLAGVDLERLSHAASLDTLSENSGEAAMSEATSQPKAKPSDEEIVARWNQILDLRRRGERASLGYRPPAHSRDGRPNLLLRAGVTEEDIDRLFPPERHEEPVPRP